MPSVTTFGAGGPERVRVRVVGCGGAGSNAVLDFPPTPGVEPVVINDYLPPSVQGFPRTVRTGAHPLKGIALADDTVMKSLETDVERELAAHMDSADLVFILAGLGGNTGTWAASVAARVGNFQGATTLAVVSLPFTVEGSDRRHVAHEGFKHLHGKAHAVLPFKNDLLLRVAPDLPILKAFQVMDHIMLKPLADLSRLLTAGDLPNLRRTLRSSRHWRVGIGEGRGDHRFFVAVEDALDSPWIDYPRENATEAIVTIEGDDLSERDCEETLRELSRRCPKANVLWGALDREAGGLPEVRVSVLLGA